MWMHVRKNVMKVSGHRIVRIHNFNIIYNRHTQTRDPFACFPKVTEVLFYSVLISYC